MEFSYRSARSRGFIIVIRFFVVSETLSLHLAVSALLHPMIAWIPTGASLWLIGWLALDFHAFGRRTIRVRGDAVDLRIGCRYDLVLPRSMLALVKPATWRDHPTIGSPNADGYLNLTKPASPNVVLILTAPVPVRLPGGFTRRAGRLALRLDDPDAFVHALSEPPAAKAPTTNEVE